MIVQTAQGKLEGFKLKHCLAFRGIPYAKAPVGGLRYLPPQPAEPWTGVRKAHEYGHALPQGASGVEFMDAGVPLDEDGMYLNVYTPSKEGKRPVMVWIHGGGFSLGSGSQKGYNTGTLAGKGDVVVVTINYRLGPFGYIYLGDHGGDEWGASANLGQLDQIAALKWVKENIAAFGGDPANVTIFGESAGSVAVAALLGMPGAKGLFHKAIGQSGTANRVARPEFAAHITDKLLKALNIPSNNAKQLEEKPWQEIVKAAGKISSPGGLGEAGAFGFWPVVDGKTIPVPPYEAVREGFAKDIPILFGSNRDESKFAAALTGGKMPAMDEATLKQRVQLFLGKNKDRADDIINVYRKSRKSLNLLHENQDIFAAITTDMQMRIPGIRLVEAQANHSPIAYNYLFCWELPALQASIHGLEIPFVFGTIAKTEGSADRIMAVSGEGAEKLSDVMMNAWVSFARTGRPGLPALPWAPYDTEKRATMVFDETSELADAPFEIERAVWDGII